MAKAIYQPPPKIRIYSDASYDSDTQIGVCGFAIVMRKKVVKHELTITEGFKNNTECEAYAAYLGLLEAYALRKDHKISLFTDCYATINAMRDPEKKRKFYCDDLLQVMEFFQEEKIPIGIRKAKAHANNRWNNFIDQSVREYLRRHLGR